MTYPPLRQQRLADVITERLEAMILEGSLKPGQRLPPERELAERFGVSRPSLREAIQSWRLAACSPAARVVAHLLMKRLTMVTRIRY